MTSFYRRLLQQLAFSESRHFSWDIDPANTMVRPAYCMAEMKAKGGIIPNAWRRHRYKWFLGSEDAGKEVVGGNKEGEEEAV